MQVEPTFIKDLLVITPKVIEDERGYFMESYRFDLLGEHIPAEFVQENESQSDKDVLRGLHFQKPPYAQAKLVRVVKGSVLDVAVDIRKNSPTYGQHFKIVLSEENKKQLFVPEGFAHGFLVLEDFTILIYKCSQYYRADAEDNLLWNDPDLAINWEIKNPILSKKDVNANKFTNFSTMFL